MSARRPNECISSNGQLFSLILYVAPCPQMPLKVLGVIHRIPLFVLRFNKTERLI